MMIQDEHNKMVFGIRGMEVCLRITGKLKEKGKRWQM